jgi:hypothetical protein
VDNPGPGYDGLEMTWYMVPEDLPIVAGSFLRLAQEHLPEVLPKRFGLGDPPPNRIKNGDFQPFESEWSRLAMEDCCVALNWTGVSGKVFCSLWYPDRRLIRPRPSGAPIGVPSALLHVIVPLENPLQSADRLAEAFVGIARWAHAFYGCGYVLRGFRYEGGVLFGGEESPKPQGDDWIGIPPGAPWLTWLGPIYANLLSGLVRPAAEERDDGLLVRTAMEPEPMDAATAHFPPLPEEVLATRRDQRFPNVPPDVRAAVIPDLTARSA